VGFESDRDTKEDLTFFMEVRARIFRSNDGSELISRKFSYKSQKHSLFDWSKDGTQLLKEEFYRSYQLIAERIVEDFFMVANFNFNFSDKHGQVCGLPPIYPERNLSFWRAHAGWEFVEIDSLKPTLKWEAFSKGKDKEGRLNRISEASYDLKVWHVEDKIPVELIYFRQGLVSSSHKLEQSLEPGNKYCWTIRARFKVNGQPRATSWARSGLCDLWGLAIPVIHDQYFRFKTPPESEIPK
jgi:hypothetical protein